MTTEEEILKLCKSRRNTPEHIRLWKANECAYCTKEKTCTIFAGEPTNAKT